jgi:hypothetical protein
MDFIPKNEMGVIVRFTQEIVSIGNISILSVRAEYPDAILLVNGNEIRTEFEYLASNFISHQHDPRECDLVICWIDNVQHMNKLPTWELSKSEWKSLEIAEVSQHQKEAFYWECRARRSEKSEKRAKALFQGVVPKSTDLEILKPEILKELRSLKPHLAQLASRLGIGRSTLYRHLGTLTEMGEVVKNGNGYEVKKI